MKRLLEKAATIKKFEYSLLDSELRKQTSIAKKQYEELHKVYGLNKRVLNKKRENLYLLYNNFNFNKFSISDEEFNDLSDDTKYKHIRKLFKRINEPKKAKSKTVDTQKQKAIVNDVASKLFNEQLGQLDN